jgi:hypothetical protein
VVWYWFGAVVTARVSKTSMPSLCDKSREHFISAKISITVTLQEYYEQNNEYWGLFELVS